MADRKPERRLSNKELAQLVWMVDGFLARCSINQEDSNFVINEALSLVEAWIGNPEDITNGFILADWLTDNGKESLAETIRKAAAMRGSLGTGTA